MFVTCQQLLQVDIGAAGTANDGMCVVTRVRGAYELSHAGSAAGIGMC